MILLLGGTSETSPLAMRLAEAGYRVLVSKATDLPLPIAGHPSIRLRSGPLDDRMLAALVAEHDIRVIVDATHPYAATIRQTACRVAAEKGIPYLSFVRPPAIVRADPNVEWAHDHVAAATAAARHGRSILLTTGTKHLLPYVDHARRARVPLIVRTMEHPDSLAACRRAGIPNDHLIVAHGPFSLEDNRRHIRAFGIGVLVTKDSGHAGGTVEKLQAAQAEGCQVVVVSRPELAGQRHFADMDSLLAMVSDIFPADLCRCPRSDEPPIRTPCELTKVRPLPGDDR